MNLPKAKELLELDNEDPGEIDIADFMQAEVLGYEAIDRILAGRQDPILDWSLPLPSETT